MVARGGAHAEGVAQPLGTQTKKNEAPEGRQNHKGFCRPSGASWFICFPYPGLRDAFGVRFTLGYHRSPLRG